MLFSFSWSGAHIDPLMAGFLLYFIACTAATCVLIFYLAPREGHQSVFVYVGICSLVGSLTVMGVKVSPCSLLSGVVDSHQQPFTTSSDMALLAVRLHQ